MIILDIESTGLDPKRYSMVSLGAVDYQTGEEFYGECRAAGEIDDYALGVNGFSRAQVTDESKCLPVDLYLAFVKWSEGREPLVGGQQVGSFDILFLKHLNEIAGIKWLYGHRSVDLHSISFAILKQSLSLDGVLKAVGLDPEPKPHNALTGARLERDAFKRLLGPPGWKS